MLSEKLLDELRQLTLSEKRRLIQLLTDDLAAESDQALSSTHYEVWSPFDSPGAAETLLKMLNDEANTPNA